MSDTTLVSVSQEHTHVIATGIIGPSGPPGATGPAGSSLFFRKAVSLLEEVTASAQEGGNTLMRGTFVPQDTSVIIEIDISASSYGWGGSIVMFCCGVLPDVPPAPWEGGDNPSLITKADNLANSGLTGVTEFVYKPIGLAAPNVYDAKVHRTITLEDLTIGREYNWEIRAGTISNLKYWTPEVSAEPEWLCVIDTPRFSPEQAWATHTGINKAVLYQLGNSELWDKLGFSPNMLPLAEISLDGEPGRPVIQPSGSYLAIPDVTNNELIIIDTVNLIVVGSYPIPTSDTISKLGVMWNLAGTKVWCASNTTGKVYRFDIATLAFDGTSVTVPTSTKIFLLGRKTSLDILYLTDFVGGQIYILTLATNVLTVWGSPLGHVGPDDLAVRDDDVVATMESIAQTIKIRSAAGAILRSISQSESSGAAHASVSFTPNGQQLLFSNGEHFGWAWVDSGQKINDTNAFIAGLKGDIGCTPTEGIVLACKDFNRLQHWPGSILNIRPSVSDPTSYGAEFLDVSFVGVSEVTEL